METIFPPFPSFLLPRHAWVGVHEGLLTSSAGRASRGPPRCSCMPVLDAAVALGRGQRRAAGEPRLAAELPLLSARDGKMPVPLGHGGSGSGYLLGGGLSISLSLPAAALCIACFNWVGLRW